MPRHSSVDYENKEEPLLNASTRTTGRQKCCYLVWLLFGTSIPLVLGFYMGYTYEEDNCLCGSN